MTAAIQSSSYFEFIPRVYAQFIYLSIDGFTEERARPQNARFRDMSGKSLRPGVDFWLKYTMDSKDFTFIFESNVGWQYECLDHEHKYYYNFNTPAGRQARASKIHAFGAARNTLTAGQELFFQFFHKYGIDLMYDYSYSATGYDHNFYLGFDVQF